MDYLKNCYHLLYRSALGNVNFCQLSTSQVVVNYNNFYCGVVFPLNGKVSSLFFSRDKAFGSSSESGLSSHRFCTCTLNFQNENTAGSCCFFLGILQKK